ncbi:hypothetical protein [Cytobacillus kochii]|uniref:hypothetical protein n=1 Tax=Cytobacillus kochii TaxID=859143 RepID=UPI00203F56FE|nr:hypothetical protein [Cytobacillus kochii]MCM3323279.1 hypothetical protein [Cytobacillus kochii]MCM3345674.1 hypothetical protein [Cytobacillus kochii]
MNKSAFEKLMWSIALPGFGQFLNKKYFKGTVLLILEFLINIQSNFNLIILMSFHGEINNAIKYANYQWLMFYPCLYFFSMWDAVKDAGGGKAPYSFLPYVFTAFFVTVGLIFSSNLKIFGVLFGPVWLPILFVFPGIIIGFITREIIKNIP